MKKLLVVAVVALLALALVACGGETATTTKDTATTTAPTTTVAGTPETTNAPVVGETTVAPETTKAPDTTVAPGTDAEVEGIDIINGDAADAAINPTWQGLNAGAFENHHSALDYHWAYVILFQESENAIYEDLFMTVTDDEGNETWLRNEDYKWVLTLDGKEYEIETFSLYHVTTYGYVRLDLGEDFVLNEKNEDGNVVYEEIYLRIYDITNDDEIKYFAYMTDPDWNGPHEFTPPAPIEMVADPNRDPSEVKIPGATAFSGPAGYSGETYENLFDYDDNGEPKVNTKLCYNEVEDIIWTYAEPVYVTSYSIIGAGDDNNYPGRVITNFKFYGSTNGTDWNLLDEQSGDPLTEATSYGERNFKLAQGVEYSYFKIEFTHDSTYQLSGIQLWTKESK